MKKIFVFLTVLTMLFCAIVVPISAAVPEPSIANHMDCMAFRDIGVMDSVTTKYDFSWTNLVPLSLGATANFVAYSAYDMVVNVPEPDYENYPDDLPESKYYLFKTNIPVTNVLHYMQREHTYYFCYQGYTHNGGTYDVGLPEGTELKLMLYCENKEGESSSLFPREWDFKSEEIAFQHYGYTVAFAFTVPFEFNGRLLFTELSLFQDFNCPVDLLKQVHLPYNEDFFVNGKARDLMSYVTAEQIKSREMGYNQGITDGISEGETVGYNKGYDVGYTEGQTTGYNNGYNVGYAGGEQSTVTKDLPTLISDICFAPYRAISAMFDFDIFGINVAGVIFQVLTVLVIAVVFGFVIKLIF